MELPISALRELNEFVSKLDEEDRLTDRQIAIRETARLLISLTHDEHYGTIDASDKKYNAIAWACQTFIGQ